MVTTNTDKCWLTFKPNIWHRNQLKKRCYRAPLWGRLFEEVHVADSCWDTASAAQTMVNKSLPLWTLFLSASCFLHILCKFFNLCVHNHCYDFLYISLQFGVDLFSLYLFWHSITWKQSVQTSLLLLIIYVEMRWRWWKMMKKRRKMETLIEVEGVWEAFCIVHQLKGA